MPAVIRVPNLIEIASVNIAIALWNHIDVAYFIWRKNRSDDWDSLLDKIIILIEDLPWFKLNDVQLSEFLSEFVRKYVVKMSHELDKWVSYNSHAVLNQSDIRYDLYCLVNFIIWYSDGTINHKETARNLMKCTRLNQVEKYHFMCTYCLEDEVKQLSSNAIRVDFDTDPLIYYWNARNKNKIHEIPVSKGLSIDSFMCQHRFVDNWAAKEYFFKRLGTEEKIQSAILLIDLYGVDYQRDVLMKLNDSEFCFVQKTKAVEIIKNYAALDIYYEDLVSTWYDVRNFISFDQFVKMFNELSSTLVASDILKEIWITAPVDFKLRIMKQYYTEKLTIRKESPVLTRLLNMWHSTPEELTRFKRDLTKIGFFDNSCDVLIRDKTFPALAKMIKSWFPSSKELCEFKLYLIQKKIFSDEELTDEKLTTLKHLLNLCVDKDDRFEEQLATNEFIINYCKQLMKTNQISMFQQLLGIFFSNNRLLGQFKRKLARKEFFEDHCDSLIRSKAFSTLSQLLILWFQNPDELSNIKLGLVQKEIYTCCVELTDDKLTTLEHVLNLCIDKNDQFEEQLAANEFIITCCQKLIKAGTLTIFQRLLELCFSNNRMLRDFKRNLAKREFLKDICNSLILSKTYSTLSELLKIWFPNIDELFRYKFDLIQKNIFTDCLNLTEESLNTLEHLLNLGVEKNDQFEEQLITKEFLINRSKKLILADELPMFERLCSACFSSDQLVTRFKRNIAKKGFFEDRCDALLQSKAFSTLSLLLKTWFTNLRELSNFKLDLLETKIFTECVQLTDENLTILRYLLNLGVDKDDRFEEQLATKEFIIDSCKKLVLANKLSTLERLLKICFSNDQLSAQFRLDLAKMGFFNYHCDSLIRDRMFPTLEHLMKIWFCRPEDLSEFKLGLIWKKIFNGSVELNDEKLTFLEHLLNLCVEKDEQLEEQLATKQFIINCCGKLIITNQLSMCERLLGICFSSDQVLTRFKRNLAGIEVFYDYCDLLIRDENFLTLSELLKTWFSNLEELSEFKFDLMQKKMFTDCVVLNDEKLKTMEHLFNLCADKDEQFEKKLATKESIINCCEKLIIAKEYSTFEKFLKICFSNDQLLSRFKQDLAKKEFFHDRCEFLIRDKTFLALAKLVKTLVPDSAELLELKLDLIRKKIFTVDCEEFTDDDEKLTLLIHFMNLCVAKDIKFEEQLAMKEFTIDYCEKLIVTGQLRMFELILKLSFSNYQVLTQFKRDFVSKKFFSDHCDLLIRDKEFSSLAKLVKTCFPNLTDLLEFKLELIQKNVFTVDYEELLTDEKLSTLKQLLDSCVSKDEKFEEQLVRNKFFMSYCETLIATNNLSRFEQMLKICFSSTRTLTHLKRFFVNKDVFYKQCERLIEEDKIQTLSRLLSIFLTESELISFKRDLIQQEFFIARCNILMNSNKIQTLEKWINLCLPDGEELAQFKCSFVLEPCFSEYCKKIITENKIQLLRRLLNLFIPDIAELISFKNYLMKETFFLEHCDHLIDNGKTLTLNRLLTFFLPDAEKLKLFLQIFLNNSAVLRT